MTRQELIEQIKQKKSFLCVGLDTDPKKMPQCVFDLHDPIFEFNKAIIDATAPYCVAYKPNLAFYEAYGIKGMEAFVNTCNYIKEHHPHHLIIADAKRGDIGKSYIVPQCDVPMTLAPNTYLLVTKKEVIYNWYLYF